MRIGSNDREPMTRGMLSMRLIIERSSGTWKPGLCDMKKSNDLLHATGAVVVCFSDVFAMEVHVMMQTERDLPSYEPHFEAVR